MNRHTSQANMTRWKERCRFTSTCEDAIVWDKSQSDDSRNSCSRSSTLKMTRLNNVANQIKSSRANVVTSPMCDLRSSIVVVWHWWLESALLCRIWLLVVCLCANTAWLCVSVPFQCFAHRIICTSSMPLMKSEIFDLVQMLRKTIDKWWWWCCGGCTNT